MRGNICTCIISAATILTLRGSSYVSFRVYDWKDRVHSSVNRISLAFKVFNRSIIRSSQKFVSIIALIFRSVFHT